MIKVAPPTTRAHVRTVGRCGKPMTVRGPSESNSRHTKAAPIATTKNGASTEPAVPLNSQEQRGCAAQSECDQSVRPLPLGRGRLLGVRAGGGEDPEGAVNHDAGSGHRRQNREGDSNLQNVDPEMIGDTACNTGDDATAGAPLQLSQWNTARDGHTLLHGYGMHRYPVDGRASREPGSGTAHERRI